MQLTEAQEESIHGHTVDTEEARRHHVRPKGNQLNKQTKYCSWRIKQPICRFFIIDIWLD